MLWHKTRIAGNRWGMALLEDEIAEQDFAAAAHFAVDRSLRGPPPVRGTSESRTLWWMIEVGFWWDSSLVRGFEYDKGTVDSSRRAASHRLGCSKAQHVANM